MNLFTKQKQTHRHRKQTYDYQRGGGKYGIRSMGLTNTYHYTHTYLNHFAIHLKLTQYCK